MQASIIWRLSQARINWEGCGRKQNRRKNGGCWRWDTDSLDVVTSRQIVSVPAFIDNLSLFHKIQKMASSSGKKAKGSPYSIAECRLLELIPVLGSQPVGDVKS